MNNKCLPVSGLPDGAEAPCLRARPAPEPEPSANAPDLHVALDLDAFAVPMWLLDSAGRVLQTNTAAAAALRSETGLQIEDGVLLPIQQQAQYLAALAEVASGQAVGRWLHWRHRDSLVALSLRRIHVDPDSPAAVALSLHAGSRAEREEAFGRQYALTRAEQRLALLFHQRLDLAQVAAELGISIGNARTALKRTLSKTGTRSQAALVLLIERALRS